MLTRVRSLLRGGDFVAVDHRAGECAFCETARLRLDVTPGCVVVAFLESSEGALRRVSAGLVNDLLVVECEPVTERQARAELAARQRRAS